MPGNIGTPIRHPRPAVSVDIKQGNSTQIPLRIRSTSGSTLFQIGSDGAATLGANSVSTSELALNAVQAAEVTISAAELAALRATPKELVAAPGSGKTIEFISVVLFLDYGGVAFTESTDNVAVKYTDGSGAAVSQTIEMTGFIDQTADTMTIGLAKNDQIVAKTGCENKALVLHNTGDGEWGGSGTSVVRAKVAYRVHTTGW